jgi:HK97 family phage prohead protease
MEKKSLYCGLTEIKLAQSETDTAMSFDGYGAVFKNIDSYNDVIEPGAFSQYLDDVNAGKKEWPAMLLQHGGFGMNAEDMTPIGVYTSLEEDKKGLKVSGQFADTQRGIEAYKLLKMQPRPAINGLSIGYFAREWEIVTKDKKQVRSIKTIDLFEISLVTFPANGKARVDSVKSIEDLNTVSEVEDWLREAASLSRNQARGLIARIKRSTSDEAGRDDLTQIIEALNKRGKMPFPIN